MAVTSTSWIIALVLRRAVNGEDRFRVLIPDPWRVWTMGAFVCQAGVKLAIRKIRHSEAKDGSNRHIMPVIFRQ